MICAYNELYLESARRTLADMFQHAYCMKLFDDDKFVLLFCASDVARKFESGVPRVLVGRSGAELVYEVLDEFDVSYEINRSVCFDRNEYYWLGHSAVYYQWKKNIGFSEIFATIPLSELLDLYPKYHEMDIEHFVDKIDEIKRTRADESNIKTMRRLCGYTQQILAKKTGVPLRSIQQYEQKQKNINRAHAETLLSISSALGCDFKDIMEF